MDSGRAEKVECPGCLCEETIPFCEGEGRVNSTEDGDEVIFKRSNSSFSCIDPMNVGWGKLEVNIVIVKSITQFLRTFIVKDVELRCMAKMF